MTGTTGIWGSACAIRWVGRHRYIQQLVDAGTISRHAPLNSPKSVRRLLLLGRDDFFIADYRLG
jgi:hypothetical protein